MKLKTINHWLGAFFMTASLSAFAQGEAGAWDSATELQDESLVDDICAAEMSNDSTIMFFPSLYAHGAGYNYAATYLQYARLGVNSKTVKNHNGFAFNSNLIGYELHSLGASFSDNVFTHQAQVSKVSSLIDARIAQFMQPTKFCTDTLDIRFSHFDLKDNSIHIGIGINGLNGKNKGRNFSFGWGNVWIARFPLSIDEGKRWESLEFFKNQDPVLFSVGAKSCSPNTGCEFDVTKFTLRYSTVDGQSHAFVYENGKLTDRVVE